MRTLRLLFVTWLVSDVRFILFLQHTDYETDYGHRYHNSSAPVWRPRLLQFNNLVGMSGDGKVTVMLGRATSQLRRKKSDGNTTQYFWCIFYKISWVFICVACSKIHFHFELSFRLLSVLLLQSSSLSRLGATLHRINIYHTFESVTIEHILRPWVDRAATVAQSKRIPPKRSRKT